MILELMPSRAETYHVFLTTIACFMSLLVLLGGRYRYRWTFEPYIRNCPSTTRII